MRASFLAVMASATLAAAEVPTPDAPTATFDVIFNVPEVQALTLHPAGGALYAAVSPFGSAGGSSVIVRWQLDPIRLDGTWATGTLVSDLAISPTGLVYAVGQRGVPPGQASTRAAPVRSGNVINLDPDASVSPLADIISYPDDGINSVSRFNQVAFGSKGAVYVASPTRFGVVVLSDTQDPFSATVELPQLVLTCGAPAQLSLFPSGDGSAYAASTTDGALLETGIVGESPDAYGKAASKCFRVTNVFGYKAAPSTLNSVVHAVLTDTSGQTDAILALEPNTSTLHLLRLDPGTQQLARADRIDLAEGGKAAVPGEFNLLAASGDGSVIFVGGRDREIVLRIQRDGDRLLTIGTLLVGSGLRSLRIGSDGLHAVLVAHDRGGMDRIHVVRYPGSLAGGWQRLPSQGETLQQVQAELNEIGFSVGRADGMLGPRTLSAIDNLLASEVVYESGENGLKSMIEGVLLTRPNP